MRRFPRFTEVESERLVDVAVEAIAERCSKDAGYLRFFIRDSLGIAEAVFPLVYERCQQDPTYLTDIVRDHVLGLSERAVLDLLQEAMDKQSLADRLGFDPLDPRRAQAYHRATSYLNRHQKVVLIAAFCVSVLMLLFPPCVEEHWRTQRSWSGGIKRVKLLKSRFAGYGWQESHTDVAPEAGDGRGLDLGDVLFPLLGLKGEKKPVSQPRPPRDGLDTVYRCEFGLLAIQFLVVWGLSGVLLVVLRNKKHNYSDYLRQCRASMLSTQTGDNVEPATLADNGGIQTLPIQGFAGHPDR
jgi:hypothetical protein